MIPTTVRQLRATRMTVPPPRHLLFILLLGVCISAVLIRLSTTTEAEDATSLRLHVSIDSGSHPIEASNITTAYLPEQLASETSSSSSSSNTDEKSAATEDSEQATDSVLTPRPTVSTWLRMEPTALVQQGNTVRGANFDTTVDRERGLLISLFTKAVPLGLSLIRELRCLGNEELIQIYHCTELAVESQLLLLAHDNRLEIIDVCLAYSVKNQPRRPIQVRAFRNWWVKPLALYHTDLKQPILLDADDLLLHDPAIIRDSEGYRVNGTMFFYDRAKHSAFYLNTTTPTTGKQPYIRHIIQRFDYKQFGIQRPNRTSYHLNNSMAYQGKTCHEQDSSMVAVDKNRAGKAMEVLWWLITRERFRVEFSFGDKESFWLAFELAQQPYAFSPWGVSVVESSSNQDMVKHNTTLCGSIAQYYPDTNATSPPSLFYVNGRAMIDALPEGLNSPSNNPNTRHNANPRHVTPRQRRVEITPQQLLRFSGGECLVRMGAVPLPPEFASRLLRRRSLYQAAVLGVYDALKQCTLY